MASNDCKFLMDCVAKGSDCGVLIVLNYSLDDRTVGVGFPGGTGGFSILKNVKSWLWGPLNLLFSGYRGAFPVVKAAGA
jgi:hypothetical protein